MKCGLVAKLAFGAGRLHQEFHHRNRHLLRANRTFGDDVHA
jgi:hypothetical protein